YSCGHRSLGSTYVPRPGMGLMYPSLASLVVAAGGPEGRSEILPFYVYSTALRGGQLGFGAAVSFLILLINLVFALAYLRLLRDRREVSG
ncbi:hypothetical protein ACWDS7_33855, partial [Streptosporangium sp. NPDC003464]